MPTVLPGQLPVCYFSPVRALKTVLFPVLGLPASAMVNRASSVCSPRRWRLAAGHEAQEEQEVLFGCLGMGGAMDKDVACLIVAQSNSCTADDVSGRVA